MKTDTQTETWTDIILYEMLCNFKNQILNKNILIHILCKMCAIHSPCYFSANDGNLMGIFVMAGSLPHQGNWNIIGIVMESLLQFVIAEHIWERLLLQEPKRIFDLFQVTFSVKKPIFPRHGEYRVIPVILVGNCAANNFIRTAHTNRISFGPEQVYQ